MTMGYSRPLALWTVSDLDLGAGLLAHRRVALFAAGLGLFLEEADHRAQGGGAGGLVGAGDVEHLPEVGDALLAGGAQAEGGQGAGLVEEGGDHLARGAPCGGGGGATGGWRRRGRRGRRS